MRGDVIPRGGRHMSNCTKLTGGRTLTLTPGTGEGATRRIATAEKIVRMHLGVRSDQMTDTASRAGAVAGDMSFDPPLLSPAGGEVSVGPSL